MSAIACRTPGPLRTLVAQKLSQEIIKLCNTNNWLQNCKPMFPEENFKYNVVGSDETLQNSNVSCRNIPNTREENEKIVNQLRRLKEWWDDKNGMGSLPPKLRKDIQRVFLHSLALQESMSRVYKLLLQIIFAGEAGKDRPTYCREFPVEEEWVYLTETACCGFAAVVDSLGPFSLEELGTFSVYFQNPSPLIAIIKNSPALRTIHLSQNVSDVLLTHIGSNCSKLEVLLANQSKKAGKFSDAALYKAFFKGFDKATVLESIAHIEDIPLSFPALKWVNLWSDEASDDICPENVFLHVLLHYYPDVISVTAMGDPILEVDKLMVPEEFGSVPRAPSKLKEITFLLNKRLFSCNPDEPFNLVDLEKLLELYPEIEHITIDDCDHLVTRPYEGINFESMAIDDAGPLIIAGSDDTEEEDDYHETLSYPKSPSIIGENLKSLLGSFNIKSLLLSNVTMAMWPFHLNIYLPTFHEIGPRLKALNIALNGTAKLWELGDLINQCINLESLKMRIPGFDEEGTDLLHEENFQLNTLLSLTTLVVEVFQYNAREEFVKCLIEASPNVTHLKIHMDELNVASEISEEKGLQVQTLSIFSDRLNPRELYDYEDPLVELIEILPSLTTLILDAPEVQIAHFKKLYWKTALKIFNVTTFLSSDVPLCFGDPYGTWALRIY